MSPCRILSLGFLLFGAALGTPVPQGPNTVYTNNPTLRTMSINGTWTVLPLDFDVVSSLVAPKKLIPVPANSKYFKNFPQGKHPVVVAGSFDAYISMLVLSIPDSLMNANIRIPCVDQLGDGKTCFNAAVVDYVGGANGQILPAAVPARWREQTVHAAKFDPDHSALKDIGGGESTFQVNSEIIPNPLSGPGVAPPAIAFTVHRSEPTFVTEAGFHYLINQPLVQNNGMCQRNSMYFNETFARPFVAAGTVQLDTFLLGLSGVPSALGGTYTNGTSYSANVEHIGYNVQDCKEAAAANDPALYN